MSAATVRGALGAIALAAGVAVLAPHRPALAADPPAKGRLLSELPTPKAGDMLKAARSEVRTKKTDQGLEEVTEVVEPAATAEETVTIPSAQWQLDVDGWFDDEGLNLTAIYPRSGLWGARHVSGKADPAQNTSLGDRAQTPRGDIGDVITHVNGVRVSSYERLVYAINSAPNKRDLPVVLMNGRTGRRTLIYVTAHKMPPA